MLARLVSGEGASWLAGGSACLFLNACGLGERERELCVPLLTKKPILLVQGPTLVVSLNLTLILTIYIRWGLRQQHELWNGGLAQYGSLELVCEGVAILFDRSTCHFSVLR